MHLLFTSQVVLVAVGFASTANILISPNCLSHKRSMIPVAKALSKRGHNVTIFTSDIKGDQIIGENLTDLMLLLSIPQVLSERQPYSWSSIAGIFIGQIAWYHELCKASINVHKHIWNTIANTHFDLVLLDEYHVCTHELILSFSNGSVANFATGLPLNRHPNHFEIPYITSYFPRQDIILNDCRNSFRSRLLRTILGYYLIMAINELDELFNRKDAKQMHKFLDLSPYITHSDESTLVIATNPNELDFTTVVNHKVFTLPLRCEKVTQLPIEKTLQNFIRMPTKGIIIVSSGHFGRWNSQVVKEFLSAFISLPEYQILWAKNFDEPVEFANKNIFVVDWIPIASLLQRRKTKLFITHGGAKSFSEAICAQVPMLIFPLDLFSDQPNNAAMLESRGLGLALYSNNITSMNILQSIRKLISDASYKRRISKMKKMLTDRLISAEHQTVHFAERILRRGDSLKLYSNRGHKFGMRKYLSIDILLLAILVFVAHLYIVFEYMYRPNRRNR